jgi:hypothetical protein
MSANTMTAAFWVLLGLSFLGIFAVLKDGITSGPSGGAVGAWLVVFPMLFLVGLGVVFALAKSEGVRMVCVALVALPLLAMGNSMMTEGGEKQREEARYERAASGADSFREPAQLRLAAALRAGDLEQVKALLPAAGDLNKMYGETTLFLYALERGQGSEAARLAIVKELLGAGANANVPPGKPLRAVSFQGREMVELLLAAGADVNYVGTDGEPYWWTWLHDDTKGEMVPLMLAHGANLQLRVRGFGPVSQAAHRGSWKTLLLLMEAGAPYKGEPSAYDGTLYDDVKRAGAPEAVKALAMMEAGAR